MNRICKPMICVMAVFVLGFGSGFVSEYWQEAAQPSSVSHAYTERHFTPNVLEATVEDGGSCPTCKDMFIKIKLPYVFSKSTDVEVQYSRVGGHTWSINFYYK